MYNARNYAHALSVTGLSLLLLAAAHSPAVANDSANSAADVPAVASAAAPRDLAPTPVTISLTFDGKDSNYTTEAKTFGDFLAEIGFHPGPDDYLSQDASSPLTDGTHAEYRIAVPLTVVYGKRKYSLHTSALTLDEAIANARIATGPRDFFSVNRRSQPQEGEVVRISSAKHTVALHPARVAANHANARTGKRIARASKPNARKLAMRAARKPFPGRHRAAAPAAANVAKSVPSIVAPISHLAETGISAARHLAGSVLHVIATAYTASCYKCSGTTASGVHAGFGIIAVDPHVIPLGTKLLIPGYGRAVAGDTGGSIVGHRVDLGMNTVAEALRFGRRPITVYVLK